MKKIIFLITLAISNQAFSDLKKELDKSIDPLMKKVVEWRHDIHQNPELSNREYRTCLLYTSDAADE